MNIQSNCSEANLEIVQQRQLIIVNQPIVVEDETPTVESTKPDKLLGSFLQSAVPRIIGVILVTLILRKCVDSLLSRIEVGFQDSCLMSVISVLGSATLVAFVFRYVFTQLHFSFILGELERRPRAASLGSQGLFAISAYIAALCSLFSSSEWLGDVAFVVFAISFAVLRLADSPGSLKRAILQYRPFRYRDQSLNPSLVVESKAMLVLGVWGLLGLGSSTSGVTDALVNDISFLCSSGGSVVNVDFAESIGFCFGCLVCASICLFAAICFCRCFPVLTCTITHAEINMPSGQRIERVRQMIAIMCLNLICLAFFGPASVQSISVALTFCLLFVLYLCTNVNKAETFLDSLRQVG